MRKAIRRIVLAAAAVIFIVSCVNLFQIFSEYRRGEVEYGEIREYAVLPETEEEAEGEDFFPMPDIVKRDERRFLCLAVYPGAGCELSCGLERR